MKFEALMTSLCQRFQLPVDQFKDDTTYTLNLPNNARMHIEHPSKSPSIRVYAYLFPAIEGFDDEIYRKVMEKISTKNERGNAIYSLDRQKRVFVLSENMELEKLTKNVFFRHLSAFHTCMANLQRRYPTWQVNDVIRPDRASSSKETPGEGVVAS